MEMNCNSVLSLLLMVMEILRGRGGVSEAKIQMERNWNSVLVPLLTVMEILRGRGGVSEAKSLKKLWN